MSECGDRPQPPSGGSAVDWAEYYEALAEWVKCRMMCEEDVCDDIDDLQSAASSALSACAYGGLPPAPLNLTPNGTAESLAQQLADQAAAAAAAGCGSQFIQYMGWCLKWTGTETTGSLRDLAGC